MFDETNRSSATTVVSFFFFFWQHIIRSFQYLGPILNSTWLDSEERPQNFISVKAAAAAAAAKANVALSILCLKQKKKKRQEGCRSLVTSLLSNSTFFFISHSQAYVALNEPSPGAISLEALYQLSFSSLRSFKRFNTSIPSPPTTTTMCAAALLNTCKCTLSVRLMPLRWSESRNERRLPALETVCRNKPRDGLRSSC